MQVQRDHQEAFGVKSRHIALADSRVIRGTVYVRDGLIQHIQEDIEQPPPAWSCCPVLDLGQSALLPGFVDAHVHLNDPRPGDPWEGFESGTKAAAAGGITTLLDMPLNSLPVTINREALDQKQSAAEGRLLVDVGLYGGLIAGGVDPLAKLVDAGVWGIKCFLCASGLDAFPATDHKTLREAMAWLGRRASPPPLLAHAERTDGGPAKSTAHDNPREHRHWLASRPGRFEQTAVQELVQLAEETGCPVHVVHVADAETIELIRTAKQAGLPITAETCPHYLTFSAEAIPDGRTEFKCAPPIREREHKEALWQGLTDGTLDFVASDHSPCPPAMKSLDEGDFFRAWGGIASLELGPAATWTTARQRGHSLADLVRWWSQAPATRFGIPAGIAAGQPATFIAFDPDVQWRVDQAQLHQRHKVSPYAGMAFTGKTTSVWIRGQKIFNAGQFTQNKAGRIITRSA